METEAKFQAVLATELPSGDWQINAICEHDRHHNLHGARVCAERQDTFYDHWQPAVVYDKLNKRIIHAEIGDVYSSNEVWVINPRHTPLDLVMNAITAELARQQRGDVI